MKNSIDQNETKRMNSARGRHQQKRMQEGDEFKLTGINLVHRYKIF